MTLAHHNTSIMAAAEERERERGRGDLWTSWKWNDRPPKVCCRLATPIETLCGGAWLSVTTEPGSECVTAVSQQVARHHRAGSGRLFGGLLFGAYRRPGWRMNHAHFGVRPVRSRTEGLSLAGRAIENGIICRLPAATFRGVLGRRSCQGL